MSKLVSIKTYEVFKSLWDNNNINELSLNFIVDTLQLYTHGMFINSATFGTESSNTIPLTIAGVSKTLALSGHTHSNYYDKTANLDIGNYSIVSGNNELLKATGGSLYLGNVSNPTYISGNHLYSIRGLNTYTILDTGNFEVTNKDSNGYTYYNKAIIKYGASFEIDYVKRDNSLTSLDNLHNYTSAGTTKVNNVTYGFITLRTDTEFSNPSWAQLRIDIPGLTVQFRTSANPDNWKDITVPTINLNALNVAGIVKAPSSSTTNKVWKTDENGNPDWRDDSNSLYSLTLNGTTKGNTGGTDLGTFYAVATSNASEANQVWMRNSDNTAYAWRTLGSRAFDSTAYLPLAGGTMTGDITFSGDNKIIWDRNSDSASISFKNSSNADNDSYMHFQTSDDFNEYFRFTHRDYNGGVTEYFSIKSDGIRVKGTLVSLVGHNHNSDYVLAVSINGNYLRVTKNNSNSDLTIPYATYSNYLNVNGVTDLNEAKQDQVFKFYRFLAGASNQFNVSNNANGLIWAGTHGGYYGHLVGFSSDGRLYHRVASANSFGGWSKIAYTSEFPTKASWNYDDRYVSAVSHSGTALNVTKNGSTSVYGINADTVDGYHNSMMINYTNTYSFTNSGSEWYLHLSNGSWANSDTVIELSMTGDNQIGHAVIHWLNRDTNGFWGWCTSYNNRELIAVGKDVGAPINLYLKFTSSCTSVTIRSNRGLTIEKGNFSSNATWEIVNGFFCSADMRVGYLYSTSNIYASNFYTTSDRNKKQNISSFSEHIRKFQLKDTEKWHYGVIAQEVPEMFREGEEGNMTVNYNSVLSYYVGRLENSVADLEDAKRLLENRVKELENEILKLKSR